MPVRQKSAEYKEPPPALLQADDAAEPDAETAVDTRTAVVNAEQHGQRVDKTLVDLAPEFSRSHLQQLIDKGHLRVDGVVTTTASKRVRIGQALHLELVPTEESLAFRPQPMALVVLYEDEHLIVLDKPAGLVAHPAPGNWSGTLLNGLLAHHPVAATLPRAGIVHRLDKDTSGVMMVGKTLPAVTALVRAMAAREVHRRYLAVTHGASVQGEFSIDAPIGRDPVVRVRMAVVAAGRASRTDVHRLGALGSSPQGRFSAFSCTLHSGRTHQIRVHLSSFGLPLVADTLYGGKLALGLQRQGLHATELRLAHPISGAALAFSCPPPADFAAAWAQVLGG